jgi:ankyrin repeat protein
VEAYPESKNIQDLKGRTPLHFSMREENMNRPEVVALLSSASGIADDNGILVSFTQIVL